MARRKTVAQLQRQLEFAQKREAHKPSPRPQGAVTQRRPKTVVKYGSYLLGEDFAINASRAGIAFFGGATALGLNEVVDVAGAPRGFKPAMIHAMVADGSPSVQRSKISGRSYIKYSRGNVGSNVQSTFSAPISDTTTPTANSVKLKYKAVAQSKTDEVGGGYGRIWITWEDARLTESGV